MSHWKYTQCQIVTPKTSLVDTPLKNIAQGSAICAVQFDEDCVAVYYEGNRYGANNLEHISERIYCAAGRLLTRYPTTAFEFITHKEFSSLLIVVGEVVVCNGKMELMVKDQAALDSWSLTYCGMGSKLVGGAA